jgi:predicted NBD/HSP70 family sugar kinase
MSTEMPIALSDAELEIVLAAARPIPPADRDQFLRQVAHELEQYNGTIGVGVVHRVAYAVQRRYWRAPRQPWARSASATSR